MFKFQSGSRSTAAAERIWLLTFCVIYSAGLYFRSWCLFSVALDNVALPLQQMGWACAVGQVGISLVFYGLKVAIKNMFSPLMAGWGDGSPRCCCPFSSSSSLSLPPLLPLSSCPDIFWGFYCRYKILRAVRKLLWEVGFGHQWVPPGTGCCSPHGQNPNPTAFDLCWKVNSAPSCSWIRQNTE